MPTTSRRGPSSSGRAPVRRFRFSLRTRVLAIALVPSLVLIGAGIGLNTYLLAGALDKRDTAALLARGYQMAVPFMPALSDERRASIAAAADPSTANLASLRAARRGMDALMQQFGSVSVQVAQAMPAHARAAIGAFVASMMHIPAIRKQVDGRRASPLQVYDAYDAIADAMIVAADAIGSDSTDRDVALQRSTASELMAAADRIERSSALAAAAYAHGGMTPAELAQFTALTGAYRTDVPALAPRLPGRDQRRLAQLLASPAWNRLARVDDALIGQGSTPRSAAAAGQNGPGGNGTAAPAPTSPVAVNVAQWQQDVRTSASTLSGIGLGDLGTSAAALEKGRADTALSRAAALAGASLQLAAFVLIVAVRMGNDLVRRLRRLRTETIKADIQLPILMDQIRQGSQRGAPEQVLTLDLGSDEIGEVAAAFGKAHQTAVAAAVQEAQLREGANAVFLNIARRSQAVLHRQLQVLDKAERATDDPDQIELLFQLDHLSTRERRNAENLIILGGGQLARQWRNSVPLIDVVRSAVSETEQYHRVNVERLPKMLVDGRAVADVIHLLAELVDNAIEFSPPHSRIEVRGNRVGKGVVLEVEDQGIGITDEARERFNVMLREPPDFGIMALSEDTRIGFFVVAKLAQQHLIKVTLAESSYGGVRAVVLIPTGVVTTEPDEDEPGVTPAPIPAALTTRARFDRNGFDAADTAPVRRPSLDVPYVPYPAGPDRSDVGRAAPAAPPPSTGVGGTGATAPRQTTSREPTRPGRHRAERGSGQRGSGPGGGSAAPERPPLPKRRRQTHLAAPLRTDPSPAADDTFSEPDAGRDGGAGSAQSVNVSAQPVTVTAQRAQSMMAAFQRGTERGRADGSASEPPS